MNKQLQNSHHARTNAKLRVAQVHLNELLALEALRGNNHEHRIRNRFSITC
jgi:hypothetical protein